MRETHRLQEDFFILQSEGVKNSDSVLVKMTVTASENALTHPGTVTEHHLWSCQSVSGYVSDRLYIDSIAQKQKSGDMRDIQLSLLRV